jgi:hypothetical protein
MRFLRGPAQVDVSGGVRVKSENVHLLTEYVLNLSISARADNDITPLYETYLGDDRLGEFEREELMWVYMSLQLSPPAKSEDL